MIRHWFKRDSQGLQPGSWQQLAAFSCLPLTGQLFSGYTFAHLGTSETIRD
jgi:hypothetical protein